MPVYHSNTKMGVRNINTGKVFPSIREAAKWAGVNKEGIRRTICNQ
jgi:DNA-binding transcriptional regulator YhcF (GntR family)